MKRRSFRCAYCKQAVPMPANDWSQAYRSVLDHVAECGPRNGAGYDEMREYIAAVMTDWPGRVDAHSPARTGRRRDRTLS